MKYSSKEFGKDILKQLEDEFDVVKMARWAHQKYMECGIDVPECVQNDILKIVAMEEGPEFEMTESQLKEFAKRLVDTGKLGTELIK